MKVLPSNFKIINNVISSKLSTNTLINEVQSLSYTEYITETNSQYISYINHFLRHDAQYSTYAMAETYTKQVAWLYKNCKDIWLTNLIILTI